MIMFETGLPAKSGPGVMLVQSVVEALGIGGPEAVLAFDLPEALGNGGPEAMLAFDLQEPCRAR